ncbi:MAG TPA: M28 family peptidase [Candidatus Aminicenantes bacterium]|nr:M28 family peptidase [Candidatus Aminicenantes bacterium]
MRRTRPVLIAILCVFSAAALPAGAQERTAPPAGTGTLTKVERIDPAPEPQRAGLASITGRDSRTLVTCLASDLLEGREAGSRGYRLASDFAASLFALWGIEPAGDAADGEERGYFQDVVMKEYTDLGCAIEWRTGTPDGGAVRSFKEHADLENYYLNRVPETVSGPVVFAGYGLREEAVGYDDLSGVEVKDKIVMILDEVPGAGDPASPFAKDKLKEKYRTYASWVGRLAKANAVAKLGPKAVLVVRNTLDGRDIYPEMGRVEDDERPVIDEPTRLVVLPGTKRGGGAICITREMADAILALAGQSVESLKAKIASRWRPVSFEIGGGTLTVRTTAGDERLLRCRNVIGAITGSDPSLKEQAVVVGAHLDHLGKRGPYVFNGADDNASGAAGVLEIARAVAAQARKPKRTTVFCLWTGEEHGLLGSTHYVRHPAFPMSGTTAYLNLDMIGRNGDRGSRDSRLARLKVPVPDRAAILPGNFAAVAFSAGGDLGGVLREADRAVGLDLWQIEEAVPKSSGTVSD